MNAPRSTASEIAARLYSARKARAAQMVRERAMPANHANGALLPWLAIACLAGADLAELAPLIAERLNPEPITGQPFAITQGEARWLVAEDICPPHRWIAILVKARDGAISRSLAVPEDRAAASDLCQLAHYLTRNLGFAIPASPQRDAAPALEQAA